MKKLTVLICMAAIITVAASVTGSLFAASVDCECFNDSAAVWACHDWCQFYRSSPCDDVLPYRCNCVSQSNGGVCSCYYWAVCADMTYKKLYLATPNCDACAF